MVKREAVGVAFFFHGIIGVSFFVAQDKDRCSPAPVLGSCIFMIAIVLLAMDMEIYSHRYMHLPLWIQFAVETVSTLALLEFCTLVVWCVMERLLHHAVRLALVAMGMSMELYLAWEWWLLGISTTVLACSFLTVIKMAIVPDFSIKNFINLKKPTVQLNLDAYVNMVNMNHREKRKRKNSKSPTPSRHR
ncbi:uncharacterized protein LOC115627535 [Scaptodrosophila lebanonensis]|uniref:Uncharacterized protein LOC115627535 n=1 Tax=Drosophila lebanonensis TaxID=7225 RepID=A0A6J2TW19_DROLE|nr:uncharacterized protein LOC115627535 [Scaptodrosophila lebanonensis]